MAEIRNPTNLEAARLVGADRTVLLDIRETVAKLVVQTSRQSGAAAVYTELFDYDGDEIYFLEDHALAGMTYAEAQLAFENATVIGLISADGPKLNPLPDTRSPATRWSSSPRTTRPWPASPDAVGVPDLSSLGTSRWRRRAPDEGAADRLERAGADRAPRARPLRAARARR